MITIGLDIGSNSIGSAWVDSETECVEVGVSVFPAGVEEKENARGAPKNQTRREKRSLRRNLARRSKRKRMLRQALVKKKLLPAHSDELKLLFGRKDSPAPSPWQLRREGLDRELTPYEFGRILLHLIQRRGALGIQLDPEEESEEAKAEGKVKDAIKRTQKQLKESGAETFGEMIAIKMTERAVPAKDDVGQTILNPKSGKPVVILGAVRNREDSFEFHADRALIRDEFLLLWKKQREYEGPLAELLTPELKKRLDDPKGDKTWRHKGILFGQRRTYWDTGTLGRCDLEPTDRCVPVADRHASYYRVLETANNIRIHHRDHTITPLDTQQRAAVIAMLRSPLLIKRKGEMVLKQSASVTDIKNALGIKRSDLRKLNLENDEDREINTDWFHREIVHGAVSEETWDAWEESKKEGLNRAVLKFDPAVTEDASRLSAVGVRLGLADAGAARLVAAWRNRPKLEKRLKLSRRALLNLIPYMDQQFPNGNWPTQIEARQMFAEDAENEATENQRQRYRLGGQFLTKADRHYLKKHPDLLPPAPTMSNPVVRKAIHEVRRHLIAYLQKHGRKPDRIVIEFARETTKSKKVSDRLLYLNRTRERLRKQIIEEILKPMNGGTIAHLSNNQVHRAIDRVILGRQQHHRCAYKGPDCVFQDTITCFAAARGDDLEIDHIIPYSRCGNNGRNNRVLCCRKCNRDKGRRTPREWWGEDFDDRILPLLFMDGHEPGKDDYFTKRDYAAKWRNLTRKDVPNDWKGSQLTDTAYAARAVQQYLQQALWPDELSHLAGGKRRILVTKGAYTSLMRKDLQLYQNLIPKDAGTDEVRRATAKNRGDHREHAVDAVAIALTDSERIQNIAHHAAEIEQERAQAFDEHRESRFIKRKPIAPPWGDVSSFRRQVLGQLYDEFDQTEADEDARAKKMPIVVSHRATGRRIVGAFHEETLFGPVPEMEGIYTGRKAVTALTPKHLREPKPETEAQSIKRLAESYRKSGVEETGRNAMKRARNTVQQSEFTPKIIDPPPDKSGLVRDRELRSILRSEIDRRLAKLGIGRDADSFTKADINAILKNGPLRMKSGVPINRVILLRTHKDPVIAKRRKWDSEINGWVRDTGKDGELKPHERSRADRAYVGGNNHHLEIRANEKSKWSGRIVSAFEVANRNRSRLNALRDAGVPKGEIWRKLSHMERRKWGLVFARIEKEHPLVNRTDDPEKGGCFMMSLSEGETVYMLHKETKKPGYFVVFKLDKPQVVQFKHHWDARQDKGEKDDEDNIIPGSKRAGMPVSAAQLRDLAPPGHDYPVKVRISPIGQMTILTRD